MPFISAHFQITTKKKVITIWAHYKQTNTNHKKQQQNTKTVFKILVIKNDNSTSLILKSTAMKKKNTCT